MIQYVLGFAFDHERNLLLIEKQKPDWQKGRWNGIGGKLEADDFSLFHAMAREFHEETGVLIIPHNWTLRGVMSHAGSWSCHVFTATADLSQYMTMEGEVVRLWTQTELMHMEDKMIENLPSLIELCLMRPDHTGKVPQFILNY